MQEIKFTSSDLWILQTFIHCTRGKSEVSLYELISVGDLMNHAIFMPGELQSGLTKLFQLGYLEVVGETIRISEIGKSTFGTVRDRRLSNSKEQAILKKLTKAEVGKPIQNLPEYNERLHPYFFTLSEFNATVEKYQVAAKKYAPY